MLPSHHLLQLVSNRAKAALDRLKASAWTDLGPARCEATDPRAEYVEWAQARRLPRKPAVAGESWGRLFDQRWVCVELPAASRRDVRHLDWRDDGEATLYVRGEPYFGFDVAHRRVALPPGVREVWVESLCCQSAIWYPEATGLGPNGSRFQGARLLARDAETWRLASDFQVLFDLMMLHRTERPGTAPTLNLFGQQPALERAPAVHRQLLRWLDQGADAYDQGGVNAAREVVDRAFADLREAHPRLRAALVGHTHIDLVWLWPERVGEAKAMHTFATVLRLMEQYPEFRFACGQPASYAAVARRAPGLSRRIAAKVRSGQWQPTGTLYVESDTLMPCGEALARSFTVGQEAFRNLRAGEPARVLWLPDVFGYAGCVPQLMRLAGVEYFFTTKLTWSGINRFPYSSFVWRGTDGSDVVAHVTQDVGYNNQLDLGELRAAEAGHAQADVHRETLHPVGFGDGGGGPTEEMCERARRLRDLVGLPAASWDQPEAFFERLGNLRRDLPLYQGELYLEYHRGTYTTHGPLKAAFRALERALQAREAVAVAMRQVPDLGSTWRRLIFAQFHDYIPGTSVPEVYAEALPELDRLAREQHAAAAESLETARGEDGVFNPLPQPWRGWVTLPGDRRRTYVALPPLSGVPLAGMAERPTGAVQVTPRGVSSDRVQLQLDELGRIERLTIDGTSLDLAGPAGELVLYPDHPAAFEAWDIDRQTLSLGAPVDSRPTFRTTRLEDQASIAVTRKLGKASAAVVRYSVEPGEPVVRIEVELDWHEMETLLKLRFPTRYQGSQARFGAPFGSVRRAQLPGPLSVEAQWEVPGSRYAAVTDETESDGLFVVTESKYGFGARSGELSVTLLRSPHVTGHDQQHAAASPRALSRSIGGAPYSDQGRQVIRLALGRYRAAAPRREHPAALAETLFVAPIPYRGAPVGTAFGGLEGGESLQPAWAQPIAPGRWVLRLHEVTGQAGTVEVRVAAGHRVRKIDLLQRPLGSPLKDGVLAFRPYEIISLLIEPS